MTTSLVNENQKHSFVKADVEFEMILDVCFISFVTLSWT